MGYIGAADGPPAPHQRRTSGTEKEDIMTHCLSTGEAMAWARAKGFFIAPLNRAWEYQVFRSRDEWIEGREPLVIMTRWKNAEVNRDYVYVVPTNRGRRILEDAIRKDGGSLGAAFLAVFS